MVKKKDLKKVVAEIVEWGENIQYPISPEWLELQWEEVLQSSLEKFAIPRPLSDKDMLRVRNSTIEVFLDCNLEEIKAKLELQAAIEIDLYVGAVLLANSELEFLSILNEFSASSQLHLSELHYFYMHNGTYKVDMFGVLTHLEEKLLETSKKIKPSYYLAIDSKIVNYLETVFARVKANIPSTLTLTSKEQNLQISNLIEIENCNLHQFCLTEYQNFPIVFLKQYQDHLKNFVTEEWIKARDLEHETLESNFQIFLQTVLDKIMNKELVAFDSSICNYQCRKALADIVIALFPEQLTFPCLTLDNLLISLDLADPSAHLQNLRVQENLEYFVDEFLKGTDQISRFFCIISVVLVISDTYGFFSYENYTNMRYSPINREWIRQIVYVAFQRKYEKVLEIHPKCSEWSLVLMTEQSIVKRIPNWRVESDLIDMTEYIQEKYAKAAKGLGDKIADFSEKLPSSNFFKKSISLASRVVKGVSSSRHIKEFSLEVIKNESSLHTTICVSGWLSQEDEMENSWTKLITYHQQSNTYALRWESGSRKTLMKKELFSAAYHTFGIIAATPLLKLAHLGMIFLNNPFKKRARKAELTGRVLADLIVSLKLGNSCVSLLGFSLGTRVIYFCLQRLQEIGCHVHDVILLGGAAPCNSTMWKLCKNAVAGRLINTYSKTDKILSRLYAISKLEKAIGNWPIEVEGIENFDVTDIATGHLKYREVLDLILQKVEYNAK